MWALCLKAHQLHCSIDRVSEQVQLPLTSEFINVQGCQVTFFLVASRWISSHNVNGIIHICRYVAMQLFYCRANLRVWTTSHLMCGCVAQKALDRYVAPSATLKLEPRTQ